MLFLNYFIYFFNLKCYFSDEPEEVTAEMVYNLRESDIKNKYGSLQQFRKLLSKGNFYIIMKNLNY